MLVYAVGVVALLALNSGILREEVLVQLYLMNQKLLPEVINVVNQDGLLVGAPPRAQRLVEALIIFQVELDAKLRGSVLNTHIHGNDDPRVI